MRRQSPPNREDTDAVAQEPAVRRCRCPLIVLVIIPCIIIYLIFASVVAQMIRSYVMYDRDSYNIYNVPVIFGGFAIIIVFGAVLVIIQCVSKDCHRCRRTFRNLLRRNPRRRVSSTSDMPEPTVSYVVADNTVEIGSSSPIE